MLFEGFRLDCNNFKVIFFRVPSWSAMMGVLSLSAHVRGQLVQCQDNVRGADKTFQRRSHMGVIGVDARTSGMGRRISWTTRLEPRLGSWRPLP